MEVLLLHSSRLILMILYNLFPWQQQQPSSKAARWLSCTVLTVCLNSSWMHLRFNTGVLSNRQVIAAPAWSAPAALTLLLSRRALSKLKLASAALYRHRCNAECCPVSIFACV